MRFAAPLLTIAFICSIFATDAQAHHPDKARQPVTPRVDVIGPLGNNLPISYRRKYNRPTYLGGKIAYVVAPSSQEAMAWHRAEHRGDYDCNRPRVEHYYFYPKPWEAMKSGPRKSVIPASSERATAPVRAAEFDPMSLDEGMISE